MSKQSNVSVPGQGEDSNLNAIDLDSIDSRDLNLNSKNFADYNLSTHCDAKNTKQNDVDADANSQSKNNETEEDPNQNDPSDLENVTYCKSCKRTSVPARGSSTPKPDCMESQMLCSLNSITTDGSIVSQPDQTYLAAKSIVNRNVSLTQEIGKKFQDLSFAFKTDSLTIQKRLHLMKRRRDQAEQNIENEVKMMKTKLLQSLQNLGMNSEYLNLMTDLKKQMDFVLTATIQLSSSAESYGYVQHEEKFLEFVSVMVAHVDNVETLNNETMKILEKLKGEGRRPQSTPSLENDGDEDRIIRRRSVTALSIEGSSRRRASIATLPRMMEGSNGKGSQWWATSRCPAGVAKKLSFSQSNSLPTGEEIRRNSLDSRLRSDSRASETSMKNIEEFPEQPPSPTAVSEPLANIIDADSNTDVTDSSLLLKHLHDSVEEIRQNLMSHEASVLYCIIRRIIELTKLLLNATRFRWPENVLHYVPFYITWYFVFVLVLVFIGGLFTGINGCFTYTSLQLVWFTVFSSVVLVRRFYRFLLPLCFAALLALILFFFWLTKVVLPDLNNEEIDRLFRTFGLVLEVRYPAGPPPI